MDAKCVVCGKLFERKSSAQKYCGVYCYNFALSQRQRERHLLRNKDVQPVKHLIKCKNCGKEFYLSKEHREYCSYECRYIAQTEKQKKKKEKYQKQSSKQPCWTCQNFAGGCSWTRADENGALFQPVEGWVAEKVPRDGEGTDSWGYKILECPEYVRDK